MSQNRQLAAIMFADIAGYTAVMQQDEALAIAIRKKLKTKLDEVLATYQGKMIDFRGDGALCSFNSTLNAVNAAIALQLYMQPEPMVPLRIGMHTGEVLVENDYLYGDVLNIASRLESFAKPGSILISAKTYDDIKNHKEIQVVSMGKYALKNVKEAVEIFAISNPGIQVPDTAQMEGKGENISTYNQVEKSIAVLPFVNMSSDPEQEYFSDGITEEIINSLTHIKGLKVAGRTSAFYFKNRNLDLRLIGQKLKVNTVLEGSIQKQGKRLRITAQLVNVEDGFHLWSERYDRTLDDIFAIQDEIAIAITTKLMDTLLENDKARMQKKPTAHTQAYDMYLKGRFYYNRRGSGLDKACRCFKKSVELDPKFALPYSGMADAYSMLSFYSEIPPHKGIPNARKNAEEAIKLDSTNVEGYTTLAFIAVFYDWNWDEAKRLFHLVFDINPGYAPAHYWYSYYLSFVEERHEEAIEEATKALDLEPLVSLSHSVLAVTYINAGRFEEGLESAKMSIELDENSFLGWRTLGIALGQLKKYEEAIEALNTCIKISAGDSWALVELSWLHSLMGKTSESQKILDELITRSKTEYLSGLNLSAAAYFAKNIDKAVEFLELAFEQRDCTLPCIKVYPVCFFIRNDPRLRPFIERLHFPEPHLQISGE